jgi:hypothetical protein
LKKGDLGGCQGVNQNPPLPPFSKGGAKPPVFKVMAVMKHHSSLPSLKIIYEVLKWHLGFFFKKPETENRKLKTFL